MWSWRQTSWSSDSEKYTNLSQRVDVFELQVNEMGKLSRLFVQEVLQSSLFGFSLFLLTLRLSMEEGEGEPPWQERLAVLKQVVQYRPQLLEGNFPSWMEELRLVAQQLKSWQENRRALSQPDDLVGVGVE